MQAVDQLEVMAKTALEICQRKGWSRGWKEAGCCLHLECSGFIEALRGKGFSPEAEAANVLFTLFSTLRAYSFSMQRVIESYDNRCRIEIEKESTKFTKKGEKNEHEER